MRIFIDADGCPVVDLAVTIALEKQVECLILCDTSHIFEKPGARTLTVSKGADSVDFVLVNLLRAGDVAITQDYGLAAMCIARKARVLNQDGMEYTNDNIDALLLARHTARRIRSAGRRMKGASKRKPFQIVDNSMAAIYNDNENYIPGRRRYDDDGTAKDQRHCGQIRGSLVTDSEAEHRGDR